ncbi:hypothetical protein SD10_17200 [Spirosoma radiotolerans]|uniref:DUF6970 domain-containing protein n=2 Tax=Spirosoma radiotolerans TaxID=1379870 RepID=A0A0E4A0B4_9BACT|nr:hypothetical protein SD10_17200 [Spirosoma radiotolerans]
MRTYLTFIILIGLTSPGCKSDTISKGTPECIVSMINQIKSQDKWSPPAKVFSYSYKGQLVYFIPQRCCDIPSILLDEQCHIVCSPDGGISGGGDGKCTDFFASRREEKLIWQDSR